MNPRTGHQNPLGLILFCAVVNETYIVHIYFDIYNILSYVTRVIKTNLTTPYLPKSIKPPLTQNILNLNIISWQCLTQMQEMRN